MSNTIAKPKLKISFVSVAYNNKEGLKRTIDSYLELRDYAPSLDTELIVVDGGSTDGTELVLKKYSSFIEKSISEKDSGIYDAMRKGVGLSNGNYICFMNSGDCISSKGMHLLIESIENISFCYSGLPNWGNKHPGFRFVSYNPYLLRVPNHQAILFPRDFLISNPFDDVNFPISADLEHKILAVRKNLLKQYDYVVVDCEAGGASQRIESFSKLYRRAKEHAGVARKHFGNFWFVINFIKFYIWHLRKVF